MKWLLVILLALISFSFIDTKSTNSFYINKDTVPTGAAPQLFGSKLYEFRNYTLIDSFLMVMGGDTFAIPRWPALKYKNSDNRWYGYHGQRWRAFLNGNDTVSLSNRIDAAVTPPGTPLSSIQYNNNGSFAGDSLLYFPAENKLLTSQDYIQFGRPAIGFFQDSTWLNSTGRHWIHYGRGANGAPGQPVDPSWGKDTTQPFYSQISTVIYDTTMPENTVYDIVKFGNTGSYRPMARMSLEQKFYNFIEWHWATKPHLMNPNDEIRHWSWTISDQNGAANLTTRSSDNRWGWPIVNSVHYDKEYAILDAQKFELKAISSPAYIFCRAGHLQQWHIGMLVDTATQEAHLDAGGAASLSLGSVSNNEIVIQNPGTSSGLILANKSFVVAGKQLQVGGLANGALGFSVTSGTQGHIWQTNADANGYAQSYSNGVLGINRDPLGFAVSERMLNIYNNFNTNDSIFHVRANGSIWTKGLMNIRTLKTTVTAPLTEGTTRMVITDTNGLLSYADIPSATTIYTGSGSLSGNTTITGAGNTLTMTGTQASTAAFSVSNTGNGEAISAVTTGTGSALSVANSGGGTGATLSSNTGTAVNATSTSGTLFRGIVNPSSTNTEVVTLRTIRQSSGTPAAGMGQIYSMDLEDDNLNNITAVQHKAIWTSATAGATSADYQLWNINAGAFGQKFTVKSTGQIELPLYGAGSFTSGTAAYALKTTSAGLIVEKQELESTPTLDFGSTAPGAATDLTFTLTGAAVGDLVVLGLPDGSVPANGTFVAWVSAANTVKVRYINTDALTTYDPTSGDFKVRILK